MPAGVYQLPFLSSITAELFEMFLPLLGLKSIQYADQEEGRARRNHYDKALAKEQLKKFFPEIQAVCNTD